MAREVTDFESVEKWMTPRKSVPDAARFSGGKRNAEIGDVVEGNVLETEGMVRLLRGSGTLLCAATG